MFTVPKKIPENLKFDIKSLEEEKANKYSHLVGVILWVLVAPFLLYFTLKLESFEIKIGLLVYIISFLMLFGASTLYHSSYTLTQRNRFRVMDHVSIYCFIAGTYTPILLFYINTDFGKMVLFSLWVVTFIGTVFKLFFVGKFKLISTVIYLLMGWTAIFIVNIILETMPLNIFYWIAGGGVFYTIGTYFYMHKTLKYTHFYWHLFVLAGAISHLVAIFLSVLVNFTI